MATTENPDAGQGPVLLDIGGDVGALVVTMPASTEDLEVEIRPAGTSAGRLASSTDPDPTHTHGHGHGHGHSHEHEHSHPGSVFPHVGVVGRPTAGEMHYSLVYPSVVAGDYELCPIPGDRVVLTATVVGGEVTEVEWPV
ncbi:MAG: hypothetical protein ABIQ61_07220 [Ornithinibacter sp.]